MTGALRLSLTGSSFGRAHAAERPRLSPLAVWPACGAWLAAVPTNDQPLRARPAKLRVPRLLAAPRYRNGCAVLLGRAWLRSAVATESSGSGRHHVSLFSPITASPADTLAALTAPAVPPCAIEVGAGGAAHLARARARSTPALLQPSVVSAFVARWCLPPLSSALFSLAAGAWEAPLGKVLGGST